MKFCYLTPPFPKKAYITSLFIGASGGLTMETLTLIQTTYTNIHEQVGEFARRLIEEDEENEIQIADICQVIPIVFSSHVPLYKKYWENPTFEYSFQDRQLAFLSALNSPQLYRLLVVPVLFEEKKNAWFFSASIPFLHNTSKETIEQFILSSKETVEESAKYAALYDFSKPIRFNWKMKKTLPLLSPPQKLNMN